MPLVRCTYKGQIIGSSGKHWVGFYFFFLMFPRGDSKGGTERGATLSFTESDPEMGERTSITSSCDNEHKAVQRKWGIINSLITGENLFFFYPAVYNMLQQ